MGHGDTDGRDVFKVVVKVAGLVVDTDNGRSHSIVLAKARTVHCWAQDGQQAKVMAGTRIHGGYVVVPINCGLKRG